MDRRTLGTIQKVHQLFGKKGMTLSVAESCTGGLISHYVTAIPGASSFFEAGVVSYSAETKKTILGVSSETVSKYGVVSDQTAREMAGKVRGVTNTDFSVATTGNLGPDDFLRSANVGLIVRGGQAMSCPHEIFKQGSYLPLLVRLVIIFYYNDLKLKFQTKNR